MEDERSQDSGVADCSATSAICTMDEDNLKILITTVTGTTTVIFNPKDNSVTAETEKGTITDVLCPEEMPPKENDLLFDALKRVDNLEKEVAEVRNHQEDQLCVDAMDHVRKDTMINTLKTKLAEETQKNQELEEDLEDSEETYQKEINLLREKIKKDQERLLEMEAKVSKLETTDAKEKGELQQQLITMKANLIRVLDSSSRAILTKIEFSAKESLYLVGLVNAFMAKRNEPPRAAPEESGCAKKTRTE